MEESRPPRGRARGRARISTQNLVDMDTTPPLGPPGDNQQQYQEMVVEEGNGNGNGGNGNGGDRVSPNGNGGNGNGRRRSSSDEEMPERQQRALDLPAFGRGFQLLRTRPEGFDKKGTSGQIIKIITNYFTLQMRKTVTFRLYKVTFDPEIDHIAKRKALLRTKEPELGPYLFEGTQLFTVRQYDPADCQFTVSFPDKPEDSWKVTLEYVRDCLKSEPVTSQLFNVLLKRAQEQLELTLLGRYYFDSAHRIEVPQHHLQLWPGFVTSMRQMENDVLLNVDLTFKVCRTDDVFRTMKQLRTSNPNNFKQACEAAIVGCVVMTTYNKKTYKITSIDWNLKPSDTFPITRRNVTETISFMEYFDKKGVRLTNPSQPMLISAATKRDIKRGDTGDKILPPEICFQTGLNEEMRANFRMMKDLGQHLHMLPHNRLAQTISFVDRMIKNANVNNEFLRWGMRIQQNPQNCPIPVEVSGRILPSEDLKFQNSSVKPSDQADWTLAFRSNLMLLSKPLKTWAIIFTGQDADGIGNLVNVMQRVSRPLGFIMPAPSQYRLRDSSINAYIGQIDEIVGQFQGKIDIIVIILPNQRIELYAAVKKSCSLKYGIPSQCFLSKNLNNQKGLMSICTKLVIQMNAKVGGQPWGLSNPLKGLMVLGFDVHHGGGRSFGAMTATTSVNLASYFSTILSSEPGVEMSAEVGNCLAKCLYAYRQINGEYPSRIMFYRDGVGEGQLMYVVESEIAGLKNTIKRIYGESQAEPKFSMIVVTKRINTRLFLQTGQNKFENPKPGTVVDEKITCPEKYDFFLVPQTARQGTVSPVGYNVISDTSGLDADKMQRFSFKLCHGYFNWSGTVAVPAPCQYAHKLAFLTGTALLDQANEKLLNNLHYL